MWYKVNKTERMNNRGFSLVELLVAVALVAVVGTAVFGFMTVGARTFTSASSEVNLQSESQLAFNQMQDLIIDTAVGIDYGYIPGGSAFDSDGCKNYLNYGNWVISLPSTADCDAKMLVMYNMDKVYEITWIKSEEKLYYTEFNSKQVGDKIERDGTAVDGPALMAEYITSFNADLSMMQSKRIVRLETTYEKGGKEYTSSHNITLRNRPLSGNSIPSYITPPTNVEPKDIIGDSDIYLKPGESYQMMDHPMTRSGDIMSQDGSTVIVPAASVTSAHKGYRLRYDPADYAFMSGPNDLQFTIRSGQSGCYSTVDPSTGELRISPAQANNFEVTVTGTYGIYTKVKKVTIHILRVESVNVTFEPDDSTAEEDTVSQNGLKKGEAFVLKAKVNTYNGITNERSDYSNAPIDYSITWDKTRGATQFDVDGTPTGPDSTYTSECRFKMGDVRDANIDIEVTATSVESVSLGYRTSSNALAPVTGVFRGKTYKAPEDPHKKFDQEDYKGKFKRGAEYVVNLKSIDRIGKGEHTNELERSLVLKDGSVLDLSKGIIKEVDLQVFETVYDLEGANEPRDITSEVKQYGEVLIKDGTSWKFTCPANYNPNATYKYVIKHNVYKHPDPDYFESKQNFYTREEVEEIYNNWDWTDAKTDEDLKKKYDKNGSITIKDGLLAEGSGVDATFPRLQLEYIETSSTPSYFDIDLSNNRHTVNYNPRSFCITSDLKTNFEICYRYDESFDIDDNNFKASISGVRFVGFKFFKPDPLYKKEDKNVTANYSYGIDKDLYDGIDAEGVSARKEYGLNSNKLSKSFTSNHEYDAIKNKFMEFRTGGSLTSLLQNSSGSYLDMPGVYVKFNAYNEKVKDFDKINPKYRVVPVVNIYDSKGERYNGDYILFDSYVDVDVWNIELPDGKPGGLIDRILRALGLEKKARCFFPTPADDNFQGKYPTYTDDYGLRHVGRKEISGSGREVWSDSKVWSGEYREKDKGWCKPVRYTLTEDQNSSGEKTWYLIIFAQENEGSNWTAIEQYTCDENGNMWIKDDKFRDKYEDTNRPILRL